MKTTNKVNLETSYVKISELKPADYNPRKWNRKAISELKESITRFGLVDPIICNSADARKNVVIGGHFRLKVAKDLGYKEVPVVYIHIPEIKKEKELNLRLNKNTGEFDLELLKTDFGLDLLLDVGFSSKELEPIWDDLNGAESDGFDTEKEIKKINEPRVKTGEIYQLGKHRLACGDSTDLNLVQRLVNKNEITVLYCDPPFNISLDYDKGFGNKSKYGGQVDDSKSDDEYNNLISNSIKNGISVCKKDAHIFYYCDENYIWLVQRSFRKLGVKLKRVCLWIKNNQNPTNQTAFNKCYEPCIYGTIGNPYLSPINNLTEIMNREVGTGNDTIEDVLDISNLWAVKRLPGVSYEHPTEKPTILHEKPIRRCSKPGDVVLDLFGGSGSTLIACEQLKRICLMVEMDPIFCEVILRRYEKLTGEEAILVEDEDGSQSKEA